MKIKVTISGFYVLTDGDVKYISEIGKEKAIEQFKNDLLNSEYLQDLKEIKIELGDIE